MIWITRNYRIYASGVLIVLLLLFYFLVQTTIENVSMIYIINILAAEAIGWEARKRWMTKLTKGKSLKWYEISTVTQVLAALLCILILMVGYSDFLYITLIAEEFISLIVIAITTIKMNKEYENII